MDNRNIHTRGRAAAYLFSLLFCFMFFAQAHSASRQADSGGHPDDRISVAQNLSLHIPKVIFKSPLGHQRFWMDMQFMPDAGEDILFEVTDFGEYTTADATVDLDPAIITSVLELLLPDISDWNPPQEPRWRAIFQHQPGDEGQIYFRLTEFDELAVPGIAATLLTALDAPGNSDTAAIMDKASELHIPRLLYQPPEGDSEFSVNLHYAPDADGLPLFMLDEAATYTAAGPDPLIKPNPALLTPELAVRIPALTLMDAAGHPVTDGHWRLDLQYIPMDDGKVYVQVTDFGRTDRKQRNRNRAMLGLLSGALVEIFALDDLSRPIYTARTDAQGHFDVTLYDIPGDTLLLVKASGGSDTDANGDGLPDDSPEVNLGAIHAFATAARLQAGWITVSPVSDIGWRYSRHMLPNAPPETLSRRLDDIAVALFRRDISGDGAVNGKDLNAFNPTNGNHLLSLDFSYRRLFQHAAESAADLGDAYRRNLNAAVETLYQYQLARFSLNPLAGAPLLLSAAAQDAGSVRLQWEYDEPAALPRAQGFRIYAKESLADIILKQTRFGMLNEQSGTVHEHLFSGLRPDTDYIFSVDAFGENIWSLISNSITARTLAQPPANLQAEAGDGQVSVSWEAVTGANAYKLYISNPDGSEETVGLPADKTGYTHAGLVNSQTYGYRVTALSADGQESGFSAIVDAMPKQTIPVPANLQAEADDGQVSVSWEAVTGASAYKLYISNPDGSEEAVELSADKTGYTHAGLVNDQTYGYRVTALSADGQESGFSASVSSTPQQAVTPLNDTGITWGGDYPDGNNDTCSGETVSAQDCSHGRDVTHNDASDGRAGFSFTRIDGGNCVQDNVTGLIWEVKQGGNGTKRDEGLHDADDGYSWHNTDPNTNGGAGGYASASSDSCYGYQSDNPDIYCNTQAYTARVNAEGWCGFNDWRMPSREELRSIVDYRHSNPSIDTDYFPNTRSSGYWSGSPHAYYDSSDAWSVDFGGGYDYSGSRRYSDHVRLVRGGQ